jgi:hypothetical protein
LAHDVVERWQPTVAPFPTTGSGKVVPETNVDSTAPFPAAKESPSAT